MVVDEKLDTVANIKQTTNNRTIHTMSNNCITHDFEYHLPSVKPTRF